jgi:quinol monooxygenase YgiN
MIVRIAELEIDPQYLREYTALLSEEIEASIALEPGVLMLHAVSIKESGETIRILEAYADQAAYQSHLSTPHFLKYKTLTANMVRSLALLETDPICLSTKPGFSYGGPRVKLEK